MRKEIFEIFLAVMVVMVYFTIENSSIIAQCIPCSYTWKKHGNCFGYAVARAFGLPAIGSVEDSCAANHILINNIDDNFFEKMPPHRNLIKIGDILLFSLGHAAYVSLIQGNNIYVDQLETSPKGDTIDIQINLDSVINGSYNSQRYGSLNAIYRVKKICCVNIIKNETGNEIPVKIIVNGIKYNNFRECFTWNTKLYLDIDIPDNNIIYYNGKEYQWEYWQFKDSIYYNKELLIRLTSLNTIKYIAVFSKKINIKFENIFLPDSFNTGNIKIIYHNQHTEYESPTNIFTIKNIDSITAKVITPQIINGTEYVFDHWSYDNIKKLSLTIKPKIDNKIIAYFKMVNILPVVGLHDIGKINEAIKLQWNRHPNKNCKYKIYRRTKYSDGKYEEPELLAILNNNDTTYIDRLFYKTSGYSNILLKYDVRAYNIYNNLEALPKWYSIYGEELAKHNHNKKFSIKCYPNPFKEKTKIKIFIPEPCDLNISIYDITGEKIKNLYKGFYNKKIFSYIWNKDTTKNYKVSSGIYLLIVKTNKQIIKYKLVLIK